MFIFPGVDWEWWGDDVGEGEGDRTAIMLNEPRFPLPGQNNYHLAAVANGG